MFGLADREPTDLELAILDRVSNGLPPIGPLTYDEHDGMLAWETYMEERDREHELEIAAGGRTRCPECDKFEVESSAVLTYGVRGRAGSEYSQYYRCRACEWESL